MRCDVPGVTKDRAFIDWRKKPSAPRAYNLRTARRQQSKQALRLASRSRGGLEAVPPPGGLVAQA